MLRPPVPPVVGDLSLTFYKIKRLKVFDDGNFSCCRLEVSLSFDGSTDYTHQMCVGPFECFIEVFLKNFSFFHLLIIREFLMKMVLDLFNRTEVTPPVPTENLWSTGRCPFCDTTLNSSSTQTPDWGAQWDRVDEVMGSVSRNGPALPRDRVLSA